MLLCFTVILWCTSSGRKLVLSPQQIINNACCWVQVRWHGKQEAMQGSLDCAQLKARQAALVDYDLDYDHGLFGDIPDPCSEEATDDMADTGTDDAPAVADMAAEVAATEPPAESKRAAEAPVTEAAEAAAKTGPSGSAAAGGLSVKARVAEAMAARGATTGGAQQAVGDNASIAGEGGGVLGKVDRDSGFRGGQGEAAAGEEPRQPLSKRMRIGIRGRSGDAHARSAASIKLLVQILDWVGKSMSRHHHQTISYLAFPIAKMLSCLLLPLYQTKSWLMGREGHLCSSQCIDCSCSRAAMKSCAWSSSLD